MTDPALQPTSCTLDGPVFRIRADEFRDLFERALLELEPIDGRTARLTFEPAYETELRDLLERETRCCSFFDFALETTSATVALTVGVPNGSEPALAFLLDIARDVREAPHSR